MHNGNCGLLAGMTQERAFAVAHEIVMAMENGYGQLANKTGDLNRDHYVVRMHPALADLLRAMTPYRYERNGDTVRMEPSICGIRLEIDARHTDGVVTVELRRAVALPCFTVEEVPR